MSSEEGFICPLCLVQFGSSSKLSGHFIEMHSESYASQLQQESTERVESTSSSGHKFKSYHHSKPSNCDQCSEIIWQDSIVCDTCGVTLHSDQCGDEYTLPCTGAEDTSCDMPGEGEDDVRETGPAHQPRGILPYVRRKVAKDRQRYVNDEFDLDLTYITEKIIAMSFPATGMATAYRNNLKDVAKMLQTKHEDNYMIFNLSERSYDITNFNNQVLDFGWPDHLAPSLERLSSVCKSMKSWLDSDPQHVAVVHCKGGKGRTGCVIAAFMHYSEICHSAEAALDRFAMKRFYDSKCGGVTQPSQRKYVHYFADLLAGKIDLQAPPVTLQHVIMHGIPNFDGKGGCRPFLKVYENMTLVHTSGMYLCQAEKERVKISIYGGLSLKGEVLIKCFHKKGHGLDPVFRCQFHSAVIGGDLRMVYHKAELDDAFKDKRFDESVRVELIFDNTDDQYPDDEPFADIRSSLLEGKTPSNGATNGNLGLDDDLMLKRNSYASFRGGYDSGMPGDDPVSLIDLESPKITVSKISPRSRSSSALSFQMDPDIIERVPHPQTAEIYTVISKPSKDKSKPEEKPVKLERPKPPGQTRASKSASQLANDSLFSFLDKSDRRLRDSSPSRARAKPQQRPLPPSPKKTRPLPDLPYGSANRNIDEDYAEINDEDTTTLSAPDGGNEPGQFVHTKPTKSSPEHAPPVIKPRPIRPPPPSRTRGKPLPEGKTPSKETVSVKEELEKKLLQQHLQKKRESGKLQSSNKQKSVDSAVMREKPRIPHPHVMRHIPSYDEIPLDNQIKVQPVPTRASAVDNDMWMAVKYPNKARSKDSMKHRSNSDDNLTLTSNSGSDFYSNLEDLDITQGMDSPGIQRSRSFSSHEDRMVIRGIVNANRDSIIPVTSPIDEPEYKNLEYAPDGTLIETPPPMAEATPTKGAGPTAKQSLPPDVLKARKEILKEVIRTHNYENTAGNKSGGGTVVIDGRSEEDYINELPEGIFHIYSNQDELLDQLRTAHQPVDEATTTPTEEVAPPTAPTPHRTRIGSAASILKLLELLNIRKPKPQSIHSQKVSDEERVKTLAPFEISGIEIGRVNRDYEAFLRTSAWGSTEQPVPEPNDPVPDTRRTPPPKPDRPKNLAPPDSPIQPRKYRRPVKQNSKDAALLSPPETPPLITPTPAGKRNPPLAKKPSVPLLEPRSNNDKHRVLPDQPGSHDDRHRPLPEQPRSRDDKPRPHPRLQATNSDAPIVPRLRGKDLIQPNRHSEIPAVPKSDRPKPPPPAKPGPYIDRTAPVVKPSESAVKSLMPFWYKPGWTRDQAIEHVRPLDPGSFVVRDSQTVHGGYALTLKLSDDHVRRRKKLAEDRAVSEEMTVTHFLVQPDPEGVKLQGWNERPFKSLSEFIAHHTVDRLCMPCRLVLPSSPRGSVRRKPGGVVQALQSGAACNLVYLGSMDVASSGDDSVLAETVQNLKSLDSNMNIVTFKASREGVTLSDNINGMFIRRQYPIASISYCGLDPNDTRWDFPSIQHGGEQLSLKDKPCFGLVYHPQDSFGYSCLVFAEFDSTQPVTSVVNLVQKAIKEHKISNRQ